MIGIGIVVVSVAAAMGIPVPAGVLPWLPHSPSTSPAAPVLANLRVIVEPIPVPAAPVPPPKRVEAPKPTDPAAGGAPPVAANQPRDRDGAVAKCYDALLDFSLGDSDPAAKARFKNQKCK